MNEFLKGFKDVKVKEKKESTQTKFDLDLKIKNVINTDKIGYSVKERSKYKLFNEEGE